jgi:hypothetical protein
MHTIHHHYHILQPAKPSSYMSTYRRDWVRLTTLFYSTHSLAYWMKIIFYSFFFQFSVNQRSLRFWSWSWLCCTCWWRSIIHLHRKTHDEMLSLSLTHISEKLCTYNCYNLCGCKLFFDISETTTRFHGEL